MLAFHMQWRLGCCSVPLQQHDSTECIDILLQGIIFAYDVTRRETFESIQGTWMKEVADHANVEHAVKMIVANKIDRASERDVSRKEGVAFASSQKCLFVETSAKANTAVAQVCHKLQSTRTVQSECLCRLHLCAQNIPLCAFTSFKPVTSFLRVGFRRVGKAANGDTTNLAWKRKEAWRGCCELEFTNYPCQSRLMRMLAQHKANSIWAQAFTCNAL
jgi:hypothetical protein